MRRATFWAIFSKTHLVTLVPARVHFFASFSNSETELNDIFAEKFGGKNWRF
jgi:hypothetical protein